MDIKLLNESCARITVSAAECAAIGIDYGSFSPDSTAARIFLAALIAKLEAMGAQANKDKITAEIFERQDKSLIIYISGVKTQTDAFSEDMRMICTENARDLIQRSSELSPDVTCRLYKFNGKYYLLFEADDIGEKCDRLLYAKIKEYGLLMSDTPLKILHTL